MLHILHKPDKAYTTCKSYMLFALFLLLAVLPASAQITIGGNVYGGGNAGDVSGNTKVTIRSGEFGSETSGGKIFGGARMANVGGHTFVHLDGENASSSHVLANYVFGGNDISGNIGTNKEETFTNNQKVPAELTQYTENEIGKTWNTFVRISSKVNPAVYTAVADGTTLTAGNTYYTSNTGAGEFTAVGTEVADGTNYFELTAAAISSDNKPIYIGQLFGGGNGDYVYKEFADTPANGKTTHKIYNSPYTDGDEPIAEVVTEAGGAGFYKPEVDKAYLEILGGSIVRAFGGGNMATVNEKTVICYDNPSEVVYSIKDANGQEMLTDDRVVYGMGLNSLTTYATSDAFQTGSLFGGNNKVEMAIRPTWNLKSGKIRNIYSGGNQGDMTNKQGLLLEIPANSTIIADNVFGGCRRADVHPKNNGADASSSDVQIPNYNFPPGYPARVLVRGGDINNVYGGNDISGDIYGGSAVGLYHSIRGDVYGSGNGSYAYTDNPKLKDDLVYGDFYYDPDAVLPNYTAPEGISSWTDTKKAQYKSAKALTKYRPNSDKVSLRVWGPSADNPTIIGGAIYVGGNSATLQNDHTISDDVTGELKIGDNVIAKNVFLGNNGENMVKYNEKDDANFIREGVLRTYQQKINTLTSGNYSTEPDTEKFNSMDLTDPDIFAEYMNGCAMSIFPRVVFDGQTSTDNATYTDYSTTFGSLYCGGNVGSMTYSGVNTIGFSKGLIIYDKLVGGCNNANVEAVENFRAAYEGGILGSPDATGLFGTGEQAEYKENGKIKNRLVLNLSGLKIRPQRWDSNNKLIWNTVTYNSDGSVTEVAPVTTNDFTGERKESDAIDLKRRLKGGNIYGGCNNSGHVNGNVVININATIIERDILFDKVVEDDLGEASLYGSDLLEQQIYHITKRNTGVILGQQGMDVLGKALNVFGGGYGKNTEIWGSTTINLNKGYIFQIFGGSENGVIGRSSGTTTDADGTYNASSGAYAFNGKTYSRNDSYSCYVNLKGTLDGVSKRDDSSDDMAAAEFLYGGAFFGPVCGNTVINLGKGRIFNSFAGSCMADILGHTETYVGRQVKEDNTDDGEGFPYVRDMIYGGNDLGGRILGEGDFTSRVRDDATRAKIYNYADILKASSYMEYRRGRVDAIFGGCFGTYDYSDPEFGAYFDEHGVAKTGYTKPRMNSAFVNFRPTYSEELILSAKKYNFVNRIYGGGQGYPGDQDRDIMQNRSYVLIDIPHGNDADTEMDNYKNMAVFGTGAWAGQGMSKALKDAGKDGTGDATAIIDLVSGNVGSVYGGSFSEGITRRTMVNVPDGSTSIINGNVFGGAYGETNASPCDVYEGIVNWNSADAVITGVVYGGNNSYRRTLYGTVNVSKPIHANKEKTYLARVYGAGLGANTWSQYTEVNLNDGAKVLEAYGGGQDGKVLNLASVNAWKAKVDSDHSAWETAHATWVTDHATWETAHATWVSGGQQGEEPVEPVEPAEPLLDLTLSQDGTNTYTDNGLENTLAHYSVLATDIETGKIKNLNPDSQNPQVKKEKYNANVNINAGASVEERLRPNTTTAKYDGGYCYAGGYGADAVVSGSAYIGLHGGTVTKDIYGGGTSGDIKDLYRVGSGTGGFIASANVYIKGGIARNVYGSGWRGSVGSSSYAAWKDQNIDRVDSPTATWTDSGNDLPGVSNVIIGNLTGTTNADGIPSVTRNVYGGGEGGAVYGTAWVTVNNGYIGYRYNGSGSDNASTTDFDEHYVQELNEPDKGENGIGTLDKGGNVFGGGYVANSYTDISQVNMYGGVVRGSLFGGGEIGPMGRGTVKGQTRGSALISMSGETHVYLYGGHVMREVFGGGRGYDNWNGKGWMSEEEERVMDLSSKGYVFGTTDVHIRGGEVGTEAGLARGFGNVFGGGDIGYVYTATGTKSTTDGYYYDSNSQLTEDCRIVVEPYSKVLIAFDPYNVGDYVPTSVLDGYTFQDLVAKTKTAKSLDGTGITIHNAVFAGGNVDDGSDVIYVNTSTVFGNATASVIDLFEKDFISIGSDGIGGLYGDGNLTFVDGYRELNITNYGTDYNHLDKEMSWDTYQTLTPREAAYYELKYKAKSEHTYSFYQSKSTHTYSYIVNEGTENEETVNVSYRKGQKITADEYDSLSSGEQGNWTSSSITYKKDDLITETEYDLMDADEQHNNWELHGFATLFYGRMINTIQRADFCGIFGSRVVLRGAQDRVPETVDYTDYTINRVKELSLNQKTKTSSTAKNGNYFGIYNVVHYLGALTSDVKLTDKRVADADDQVSFVLNGTTYGYGDDGATYYNWKQANLTKRSRNNGESPNEVALSSGVWLEILDEATEKSADKIYGPITGVVQLDLINVTTGEGGGYVYAKNEHRTLSSDAGTGQTTLSDYNDNAVSYKQYTYSTDKIEMQTSGNFINPGKRIIDDCFPLSGAYQGDNAAPAHYWYLRGEVYVYDQYISAYTGSANAYAEVSTIPLTITAEAQGRLKLESIYPNLTAYWDDASLLPKYLSTNVEGAIVVGGKTYRKNDPISYWAWSQLNDEEKALFVADATYVCTNGVTYGGNVYKAGDVFTTNPAPGLYVCMQDFSVGTEGNKTDYKVGDPVESAVYTALSATDQSKCALAFNPSNVVDHDNGFLLTFDWDNPDIWNDYYHAESGVAKERSSAHTTMPTGYVTSPSFKCTKADGGVFGQLKYTVGDIIDFDTYDLQTKLGTHKPSDGQAEFAKAYVAKASCQFVNSGTSYEYVKGACITETQWSSLSTTNQAYFDEGMLVTETYSKSDEEHYLYGDVIPLSEYNTLLSENSSVSNNFSKAYLCYTEGKWGGKYFEENYNYPAEDFSNLSADERSNFVYNYDALNLLIDKNYQNILPLYDSSNANNGEILYAKEQMLDYTATYTGADFGTDDELTKAVDVKRGNTTVTGTKKLQHGDVLDNVNFEKLTNEQLDYSPIVVQGNDIHDNYYVVKESFQVGDKIYNIGSQVSAEDFGRLSPENKNRVITVAKTSLTDLPTGTGTKRYYVRIKGTDAEVGAIKSETDYSHLTNEQINFTIEGIVPTEKSTLYVAREASIDQLSQDKIITVSYLYNYIEGDDEGSSYEYVRERHVVNIHIHFESGVPSISQLSPPNMVLPGDMVTLSKPRVDKGAYEILGGGWEIFPDENQAIAHQNGEEYSNGGTPTYWYQDGYYVAYYAKSYLGKTYSNPVRISVANYHDIEEVMDDKEHHMYIDHDKVQRAPKIYIDNRNVLDGESEKSELDMLSDLFNLSLQNAMDAETGNPVEIISDTDPNKGHKTVSTKIRGCNNLEFFLKDNVSPKKYTNWTSIGTTTQDGTTGKFTECFEGTLHGDGYTISGLNNSLFQSLCGEVYNLGVTGTFNGAGIVETGTGYIENCWIKSDDNNAKSAKPLFNTPARNETMEGGKYDGKLVQIVNSYYPEENNYTDHDANVAYGKPTEKPLQSFYNGEVSYDLNGFYLNKRYNDKISHETTEHSYQYFDGKDLDTENKPKVKTSQYKDGTNDYVEQRYTDGDFRYAGGSIPDGTDQHLYTDQNTGEHFYPIWPDDYLFFGQALNYGHVEGTTHDDWPKHINVASNRVYRAPAYFQSKNMGVAHFNRNAILAAKSSDATHTAYPGMTAIDFTGQNETTTYQPGRYASAPYNNMEGGAFYPPLLDDDGLTGLLNVDLTKNLLVYTGTTAPAQVATNTRAGQYLAEPTYLEDNAGYRNVPVPDILGNPVNGHWVTNGTATRDHYLVDKQDFNAPIQYTFASGKRMWYQRKPENFAGQNKTLVNDRNGKAPGTEGYEETFERDFGAGWEGISIPFSAELVTTDVKGEITHFYANNTTGHEYWLREFKGGVEDQNNAGVYVADFNYPAAGANSKSYTNTFLWDYYYNANDGKDKNEDIYQRYKDGQTDYQRYYAAAHSFQDYPYLTSGVPYIVGFPGQTYYEFDLSGYFVPKNTYVDINKLKKQTITFASPAGTTIKVSDDELAAADYTKDNKKYTFTPNYLGKSMHDGSYRLNADGSAYEAVTGTGTPAVYPNAVPFRPYFTVSSTGGGVKETRSIVFNNLNTQFGGEADPDQGDAANEGLLVSAKRKHIYVTSAYNSEVQVTIVNTAGAVINSFSLQPGETMETQVASGVYLVNKIKIAVK